MKNNRFAKWFWQGAGVLATASTVLAFVQPNEVWAANLSSNSSEYVETNHGWVDMFRSPSIYSPVVGKLELSEQAPLVKKYNNYWYEVDWQGQDVFLTTSSRFVHLVTTDSTQTVAPSSTNTASSDLSANTTVNTNGLSSATSPSSSLPEWKIEANKVIAVARTQLGVPYWWGHQVPGVGFDCSNFTAWVYRTALGIRFSSSSVYQRYHVGTPVPLSQIREGDLLFFRTANNPTGGGHVGIYEGNGMLIEEGGGYGKVVQVPLYSTWFGHALVFARQVIPNS